MKKKCYITETVLRDGHQSLMATRMKLEDMISALKDLDSAGYYSLEVWGGATFDACMRYLDEDPWQRLRILKKHLKNTKLQMLLRGQHLCAYRPFHPEVIEAFVKQSIINGIDIVRCFDALNDVKNLEFVTQCIRKYGGHAQLCICYTVSPVHHVNYYISIAQKLEALGAHSLVIKDMSGILTPKVAQELVEGIKAVCTFPLHIHTHLSTGMGCMTYLKAIESGVDGIDTALSSFAGGSSQPATETMLHVLQAYEIETQLDIKKITDANNHFKTIRNENRFNFFQSRYLEIDPSILQSQIPGGMLSNLREQLKSMKLSDRYDEVVEEIPKVRKDLGYPPLVTPLSQMVATQAVMNTISKDRYQIVPSEIKHYVSGLYGTSCAPINTDTLAAIGPNNQDCESMQTLDAASKILGPLGDSIENVLSYLLYPTLALDFFKKNKK